MQGCSRLNPLSPESSFRRVFDVSEIRDIIASLHTDFEQPLAIIREAIESLSIDSTSHVNPRTHLSTASVMCHDVARLTYRYLDYIDQVQALPVPKLYPIRSDLLLEELNGQIKPVAFRRGVVWNTSIEAPIRPILTDPTLWCEAIIEWAKLAVESANPGDLVSVVVDDKTDREHSNRMVLNSSSKELITHLTSLREDFLFSRHICLEEIGMDPGSRLALSLEKLLLLDVNLHFDHQSNGLINSVQFHVPTVPETDC